MQIADFASSNVHTFNNGHVVGRITDLKKHKIQNPHSEIRNWSVA